MEDLGGAPLKCEARFKDLSQAQKVFRSLCSAHNSETPLMTKGIGRMQGWEESSSAFVPFFKDSAFSNDSPAKMQQPSILPSGIKIKRKLNAALKAKKLKKYKNTQPVYKYRNIYKAIIRRLYGYVEKNRETLMKSLESKGFDKEKIELAFNTIKEYKPQGISKEIERGAKLRIEVIINNRSICMYILRETLIEMIEQCKNEEYGQICKGNHTIYIEGCTMLLERIERVINEY
jgi:hypothetical protein